MDGGTIDEGVQGGRDLSGDGNGGEGMAGMAAEAGELQALRRMGSGSALRPFPTEAELDINALRGVSRGNAVFRKPEPKICLARPRNEEFFQIHPDLDQFLIGCVVQVAGHDGRLGDLYVLAPDVAEQCPEVGKAKILVPCALRRGGYVLWPVRYVSEGERRDSWTESAYQIIHEHTGNWIRVQSGRGAYSCVVAQVQGDGATWPDGGLDALYSRALKGRVIQNVNHPVLRQLRGEVL